MVLDVEFRNPQQRSVYYTRARNVCFSGGFNNGKTFICCLKILTSVLTFSNSRAVIARQTYTDLKKTTMETFFKLCPPEMIYSHNIQDGVTILKNGSIIFWLHMDGIDESTLRGLEINWVFVDQAEEIDEKVYDVLDSRLGRWDKSLVPQELIDKFPVWPKRNGSPIVPSWSLIACNPDTEFHWIYRKFHPSSIEKIPSYEFYEGEWDSSLGSIETYEAALRHDQEWVDKYIRGKWGSSTAQIHRIHSDSLLEYSDDLIERIRTNGRICRVLDHGDSSPTCCAWAAALDGVYIFYREYYVPGRVISHHRSAIHDLSQNEHISASWADPQIFKKTAQKQGGFWSVADEYMSSDIDAPSITWMPADNNEYATRNRINELLMPSPKFKHPVTHEQNAPGIYFVKRSTEWPWGCHEIIKQMQSQRRKLLGTIDGKSMYSDERDESVVDHAYDVVRYYVAMHGSQPARHKPQVRRNTFAYFNALLKRRETQQGISSGL